jgi:hypothetical protein
MKNLLLLFCFALSTSLAFGQVKVVQTGETIVGPNAGITPVEQLHVEGRYYANGGTVVNTGASAGTLFNRTDESAFIIGAGNDAGMSWDQAFNFELRSNLRSRIVTNRFIQNGTLRFKILGSNGNVGIGRNIPAEKLDVAGNIQYIGALINASDKRLKSNVQDFGYGLEEVLQLNPVSYNYTDRGTEATDELNTGLLAQELKKVAPELVKEFELPVMNEDQDEVLSVDSYLGIKESSIKYMLINAIQDQQELIEAQAEKIAQLEEAFSTIGSAELPNNTSITLTSYDLAELGQNAPNPFNGTTFINYVIPSAASSAQVNIFGTNGQMLKTLDIDHVGEGTLELNAQDLPTGTYSYQLVVDGRIVDTHKMVQAK